VSALTKWWLLIDAPPGYASERSKRAVLTIDRNVAHAAAGLGTGPVAEKRAIEKKTSAPSIRAVIAAVTAAGYRASGVSARISTPTLAAVSLAVSGFSPPR
jgi:hypothetical protein